MIEESNTEIISNNSNDSESKQKKEKFEAEESTRTKVNENQKSTLDGYKKWDISQGDFNSKPLKIRRRLFRKEDLKRFIKDLWFILLTIIITLIIMKLITKID
ncbi:MAG: hypothetical protein ACPL25_02705 [Ignavibacteria bacterium]